MNPYKVPGSGSRPGPLCPHDHPVHEDLYVPVDNTLEAFEKFKRDMGDLSSLRTEGKLVLSLGWDGCGKTSLLNRCANWLKDALTCGEEVECLFISLADACAESDTRRVRKQRVYRELVDELSERNWLDEEQRSRLNEYQMGEKDDDDLSDAYRYLSKRVLEGKVLVVLLPRTEIPKELENYSKSAYRGIVFLAESRKIELMREHWPTIRQLHNQGEPIRLEVGLLTEHDPWKFVHARQDAQAGEPEYPFVSEETIHRVTTGWDLSIGKLHALLYGVYQELHEKNGECGPLGSPPAGEVTYQDITDFFFRRDRNM